MFTVDQLHEYRKPPINPNLLTLVPKYCQYCKSPIIINYEMTILRCSNHVCPKHMSYRADNMFKALGIKQIGDKTAYTLIVTNKLKSHIDILALTLDQMPSNSSKEVSEFYWNELQKGRKQTPDSILSLCAIDKVSDTTSTKLLNNYPSLTEFFASNPDVPTMSEHIRRSLSRSKVTDTITKMACHLLLHKEEILRAESYFEVTSLSQNKINICITGDVTTVYSSGYSFSPRENFVKFMNEKYEGIVSFVNTGRSVTNADVLVTDSTRKTGKYKDALDTSTPIHNFANFTRIIEERFGSGNESYEIKRRI